MTTVLVPLAEGCEELEAVTIIDLLRRAEFDVVTAGLEPGPLTASRGVKLVPDTTLEAVVDESFDLVVLPGGAPGVEQLAVSELLGRVLHRQAEAGRWLAAVCAAPSVLARHGLLDDRRATSYPGWLDPFADRPIDEAQDPVVVDGRVVTSRGPGTAMDFALTLIAQLAGEARAAAVEAPLQRPDGQRLFAG